MVIAERITLPLFLVGDPRELDTRRSESNKPSDARFVAPYERIAAPTASRFEQCVAYIASHVPRASMFKSTL